LFLLLLHQVKFVETELLKELNNATEVLAVLHLAHSCQHLLYAVNPLEFAMLPNFALDLLQLALLTILLQLPSFADLLLEFAMFLSLALELRLLAPLIPLLRHRLFAELLLESVMLPKPALDRPPLVPLIPMLHHRPFVELVLDLATPLKIALDLRLLALLMLTDLSKPLAQDLPFLKELSLITM
jgi:hypothetical protein